MKTDEIEQEIIPCIIANLDVSQQNQIEIVQRMSEAFGTVVYKMSEIGLHLKYRKEFIEYYR